jgi:hypothetical protein
MAIQLAFLTVMPSWSQMMMQAESPGERIRLLPMDATVLDDDENRKELPCSVKPLAPKLGFDLRFHSGFEAIVPYRDLSQTNRLTVIFRVTPEEHPGEPIYFDERWTVPQVEEDTPGLGEVHGGFILGPGKYHIEWLMRDRHERFCSARWKLSADTRGRDNAVEVAVNSGTVIPESAEPFANEVVVKRPAEHALKVLVFLHIAPGTAGTADTRAEDNAALISIVRNIAREPRIGAYSIVAFNLEQNQILYRGRSSPQVDFHALGSAMNKLKPGIVDVRNILHGASGADLLGEIVDDEMTNERPDAVIFVGQRTATDRLHPHSPTIKPKAPDCPVFYLNYNANPFPITSTDSIGSIVKLWKGFEYTISKPRDVFTAWAAVMREISKRRTSSSLTPKN